MANNGEITSMSFRVLHFQMWKKYPTATLHWKNQFLILHLTHEYLIDYLLNRLIRWLRLNGSSNLSTFFLCEMIIVCHFSQLCTAKQRPNRWNKSERWKNPAVVYKICYANVAQRTNMAVSRQNEIVAKRTCVLLLLWRLPNNELHHRILFLLLRFWISKSVCTKRETKKKHKKNETE